LLQHLEVHSFGRLDFARLRQDAFHSLEGSVVRYTNSLADGLISGAGHPHLEALPSDLDVL
jgi:hypothetical protein